MQLCAELVTDISKFGERRRRRIVFVVRFVGCQLSDHFSNSSWLKTVKEDFSFEEAEIVFEVPPLSFFREASVGESLSHCL